MQAKNRAVIIFGHDRRVGCVTNIWGSYMCLGVIFCEESNGDVDVAVRHLLLCVSAKKVMTSPDLV